MEFFNFRNQQTFQFFIWVMNGGLGLEPSDLSFSAYHRMYIAYDEVEDDTEKMFDPDIWELRETLAELLRKMLLERLGDELETSDLFDDWYGIGKVDSTVDSLTRPILELALAEISFEAVAQAILIHEKKWTPRCERPEAKLT